MNHQLVLRGVTWHFVAKINGKKSKELFLNPSRKLEASGRVAAGTGAPTVNYSGRAPQNGTGTPVRGAGLEMVRGHEKEVKKSTLEDYKYSMNRYILPRFGNDPMSEIGYLEIRKFVSELACSHKRKNNVLVPMRSVLKMAFSMATSTRTRWTGSRMSRSPNRHLPLVHGRGETGPGACQSTIPQLFHRCLLYRHEVRRDGGPEMEARGLQAWCHKGQRDTGQRGDRASQDQEVGQGHPDAPSRSRSDSRPAEDDHGEVGAYLKPVWKTRGTHADEFSRLEAGAEKSGTGSKVALPDLSHLSPP
ncbi:MAG: hypothetical protein IPI61_02615 [Syntrophaceae bacterium]|nr:hypothetical protein [Syntrophaceae bacterium]